MRYFPRRWLWGAAVAAGLTACAAGGERRALAAAPGTAPAPHASAPAGAPATAATGAAASTGAAAATGAPASVVIAPLVPGEPLPAAVATLAALRDACDALTPPERKTFGGAGPGDRDLAKRTHAEKHALAVDTALAFRVAAKDVKLGAYDAAAGVLPVAVAPALRGLDGALALHLSDVDVLELPAPPDGARALAKAVAAGAVSLRVSVLPDEDTMVGAACWSYPKSDAFRLHGMLLEAALVRDADGAVLARVRTPLHATWLADVRARAPRPSASGPHVFASKARVVDGAMPPGEMSALLGALGERLLPCYRKVLVANPGLKGALVLSARVDRKGRAHDLRASIDMLHAGEVTACVLAELSALSFPRPSTAEAVLDLPIYFEP
ncbi:MAG TPA: AgmX/PglI C-terminal domain-containing protein [Myxococcota bacterium]|jgi:hypothetical protein|nr:AgmX/PglI C-terminal domain-containing protein [Myxococcota bacterium]